MKTSNEFEHEIDQELLEAIEQWEDEEIPTEYSNPDPYAKVQPLSSDRPKHDTHFDESGNICVKNISAFWIPELTVTEVIKGDVYTVTGSYEGTASFVQKLERITAKKFTEKMEGHQ